MILETAIAGLTAIVLGSIWLADRVTRRYSPEAMLERDLAQEKAAIAEKRRVIERKRDAWCRGTARDDVSSEQRQAMTKKIEECDADLLALADEEAKL